MIKNYTVGLYNKGATTKVNGVTIPGVLTRVKDIDCDIQPYSQALLLKTYGYNIECNKRIFVDYDIDIKIGTVFYYTNLQDIIKKYEVKTIIDWDYMELACLEVA